MYSTARKLAGLSMILSVVSILGLIMVSMYFSYLRLEFHWFFALMMFLIAITGICLFLTISIRNMLQDLEMDYDSNARQLKKLSDRITELEKILK
jgi:hypothetical protein